MEGTNGVVTRLLTLTKLGNSALIRVKKHGFAQLCQQPALSTQTTITTAGINVSQSRPKVNPIPPLVCFGSDYEGFPVTPLAEMQGAGILTD